MAHDAFNYNSNTDNNSNRQDDVYGAVVMAQSFESTQFVTAPLHQVAADR